MAETIGTLATLVTRIRRLLGDSPETDTLAGSMTSSITSMTVTSPRLYGKGAIVEIGDELVYTTTDMSGFTTTVVRGYAGTTAVAHNSADVTRISPRYTSSNIKEAINVVLGDWISFYCPQLYWDSTTAGTFVTNRDVYAAPADAMSVRRVCYKPSGTYALQDVPHGPLETFPTAIASTGKGVMVRDLGPSGFTVYGLYERPWTFLSLDADTVDSDFPLVMDNLIVEGAVLYLLGWRFVPKFRADETIFAREQGQSLPSNFSVQALELMRRNWIAGIHRMQYRRAQTPKPRKVIVD